MIRFDEDNSYELTDHERKLDDWYENLLDMGLGIADAVRQCQAAAQRYEWTIDPDFWAYLAA